MKQNPHVVAISGSLGDESGTRIALETTLSAAREAGATAELVDLRNYELPTFDSDRPEAGDAPELTRTVREADAVVLGSPMYHGSYASPLKTALDYCGFDEFEEKTVGLLVVSGGGFPTPALDHLRTVARALNAWTLPTEVAVPNSYENFADGELVEEDIRDRVETLGREIVAYAGVDSYPDVAAEAATVEASGD